MKLGADRKKLSILGALLLVLAYFLYSNFQSDEPAQAARATTPRVAPKPAPAADLVSGPPAAETRARPSLRPEASPLRPAFKEKTADPATTDPTIRLDLLAKVQKVDFAGGERNLFQFGAAPLPKTPEPKIVPNPGLPTPNPGSSEVKPADPPPPPPPPIPLKFYGYSMPRQPGVKRGFFLQGDEILVAAEGELIQRRYKVVRININSCVVEDTQFKNQQTLPLEEPAG
jgi:hypothetical protein